MALAESERAQAFLQLWTLKEAFIKATGKGLTQDLAAFSVTPRPPRIRFASSLPEREADWWLEQQLLDGGFIAALGLRRPATVPVEMEWTMISKPATTPRLPRMSDVGSTAEEPMVCATLHWREMDSNFQYAGAVNLVVGPFGWGVLCDRLRSGRGASDTARHQRRGWAILAAGLGAAHRRSDLWCARMGATRSGDRLFSAASNDIRCTSPACSSLAIRRARSVPEERRYRQPPLWTWQHADISAKRLYGGDLDPLGEQCHPMERVLRPHREAANQRDPLDAEHEGVKAALMADADWQDGWFATPPTRGFQAMGRVYAGSG